VKKTTLDLTSNAAWTNAEAVDAHRERILAEAEALDAEIRSLVQERRRNRYQLCLRLGRMRREQLWKALSKRSFVRYAVGVGAAGSSREARQWADVADRLRDLPAIHAVFAAAKASPSAVREVALVATPGEDAEWARKLPHMTVDQVRAELDRKLGRPPTSRLSLLLPEHVMAQLLELNAAQSHLHGKPVALAETIAHLVGLGQAERARGADREQPGVKVLPARQAQVHTRQCDACSTHELRTPKGWVALPPTESELLACDVERVNERGEITRNISERTRRIVFEADGMACAVPGCGATLGLHYHHEAPAGWRDVGDDPEFILLICSAHHRQRHEGWLTIKGARSTGFRFFRHGGGEILAPPVASVTAAVAHVGNSDPVTTPAPDADAHAGTPSAKDVDELAERTLRALELKKSVACAAIQRVRAQEAGPLTVEELVTLALRGLPSG
jgi:hypothetical protein